MTTETKSRVAVLDGLRAMAIILVLMRHGIRPFWFDLSQPFLPLGPIEFGSVFINGWMGVDLFFVLSGYLITNHLLVKYFDPVRRRMDLRTYAKKRFLRIAPAYYFVLTVAVLGLFPFYPYPESWDHIGWRYIYHLLFMQDYLPSDIIGVFWSLAVEIKFYLLAPFVLLCLLKLPVRMRIFTLMWLFAMLPVIRFSSLNNAPAITDLETYFESVRSVFHLCLDGLVGGMMGAIILQDETSKKFIERRFVADALFVTGAAIFIFLSFNGPLIDVRPSLFDTTLLPTVIASAFTMIMLGLMGGCFAVRLFAWKGWLFFALISYSLYLVHLPLMYSAEVLCRYVVNLDLFSRQMQMLIYFPFFIGLSVIGATLCYCLVERPFLKR